MSEWTTCPRCDLAVKQTANGWRHHDEFCNGAFQPYMTMLTNVGIRPFERVPWINPETEEPDSRVLGELLPLQWRVAPDQWYRLEAEVHQRFPALPSGTEDLPARLFGWPIEADTALASGEIVLEPRLATW